MLIDAQIFTDQKSYVKGTAIPKELVYPTQKNQHIGVHAIDEKRAAMQNETAIYECRDYMNNARFRRH